MNYSEMQLRSLIGNTHVPLIKFSHLTKPATADSEKPNILIAY